MAPRGPGPPTPGAGGPVAPRGIGPPVPGVAESAGVAGPPGGRGAAVRRLPGPAVVAPAALMSLVSPFGARPLRLCRPTPRLSSPHREESP